MVQVFQRGLGLLSVLLLQVFQLIQLHLEDLCHQQFQVCQGPRVLLVGLVDLLSQQYLVPQVIHLDRADLVIPVVQLCLVYQPDLEKMFIGYYIPHVSTYCEIGHVGRQPILVSYHFVLRF